MKNKTIHEIQQIKEKLIDLLYWIISIIMWFVLAGSLYRTIELGIKYVNFIQIFTVIIILIVFIIRKRLAYLIKTWILLFIIYIIGTSSIIGYGLISHGPYILMLFTILASTLIDQKWGLYTFILSFLTLSLSAFLFLNNIIPQENIILNYQQTLSAWAIGIVIFSTITWIILIFWQNILNFLVSKIKSSLIHEETLNKVNKLLSKEIESRKTAEFLLNENNFEIKKLNKEYQVINEQLQSANNELEKSNLLINDAKQKAQSADKLKTSFLSNMSHEIRTPMNAIVGFASLIGNEDISAEDKKNYLSIIKSSSDGLLNTISDIITIAKIESGQITLYPSIIDLNNFIDEFFDSYKQKINLLKGDNIALFFEKKIPDHCRIITDLESLNQIIYKLIDNAIKFTEKGYIKILLSLSENNFLTFQIQDTGIGIGKETENEIFETFRQLDFGNTKKYSGTGIGLSIAKGLINILNGTIEFTSSPKQGSTFNFAIPIINQTNIKNIDAKQHKLNGKGKTILIIGKYTWDNRNINEYLQELNAVLIYVESGFQALDIYKDHPEINLVIMSMFLPDMNGHEVAKILKKSAPKLPILAHMPIKRIDNMQSQNRTVWDNFIESAIDKKQFRDILNRYLSK